MKRQLLMKLSMFAMALLAGAAQASTITFIGPEDTTGAFCPVGCVIGSQIAYTIFDATLTSPTMSDPDWVLTIGTDYQAGILDGATSIPTAIWPTDGLQYSIPDFLITSGGQDYGIVLSPHVKASTAVDSYTTPGLYQAAGFQTSSSILSSGDFRPNVPVWLDSNGKMIGSVDSELVTKTGDDGVHGPLYNITVDFTAPSDFLSSGDFSIEMSSFVCANGLLIGSGGMIVGPQSVPEPSTLLFTAPLLLLAGYRLFRR